MARGSCGRASKACRRLRRARKDLVHFLFRNQALGHLKRKRWLPTKAQHVPGNLKCLTNNPVFERGHNRSKVPRDTPIFRHSYYYNAAVIMRVTVASLRWEICRICFLTLHTDSKETLNHRCRHRWEQRSEIGFPLPPCVSWELNSVPQAGCRRLHLMNHLTCPSPIFFPNQKMNTSTQNYNVESNK